MKNFVRATLLTATLMLTACVTPTAKLNSSDAAQLKGKGITTSVIAASSPASNLNGAIIFGALGQVIQGNNMQNKLQMVDPALKIEENLQKSLTEKFGTTSGNEYKLTLHTTYWWLGKPIGGSGDNIVTAAIIEMKLTNPAGKIIASDTFNGGNDGNKTPINPSDIKEGRTDKINAALNEVAEKATSKFLSTLLNQN